MEAELDRHGHGQAGASLFFDPSKQKTNRSSKRRAGSFQHGLGGPAGSAPAVQKHKPSPPASLPARSLAPLITAEQEACLSLAIFRTDEAEVTAADGIIAAPDRPIAAERSGRDLLSHILPPPLGA